MFSAIWYGLKKFWAWIKRNWKVLTLIIGAIIGFFLFRRRETSFVEDYKKIQEVHETEVKEITKAREEEVIQREENKKTLEKTLKVVEEQYQADKTELDKKKKKEIKKIVDEHGADPVALADELTKVTGFRVILPPED